MLLGVPYALITNGLSWDLIESVKGITGWKQVAESSEAFIPILMNLRQNTTKAIEDTEKRLQTLPNQSLNIEEAFKVFETFTIVETLLR